MTLDVCWMLNTYIHTYKIKLKLKLFQLEMSENLTIAPLQCFACSKRQEFLRILSGYVILTSIKGNNSLTNL